MTDRKRYYHVVSTLSKDHELVQAELAKIPSPKVFHQLKVEEDHEDELFTARSIADQILDLGIYSEPYLKVGDQITFVLLEDQIFIEHLCVTTIQRRFNEAVAVYVRRPGVRDTIPYLIVLEERNDKERLLSFGGCGSCSGNCESC